MHQQSFCQILECQASLGDFLATVLSKFNIVYTPHSLFTAWNASLLVFALLRNLACEFLESRPVMGNPVGLLSQNEWRSSTRALYWTTYYWGPYIEWHTL